MTAYSRVSAKGQTTIPREIREQFGITPHTRLSWSTEGGIITVVPMPEDPVEASFGILKGKGFTFEDFMEERQRERELDRKREERLEAQVERALRRRKE